MSRSEALVTSIHRVVGRHGLDDHLEAPPLLRPRTLERERHQPEMTVRLRGPSPVLLGGLLRHSAAFRAAKVDAPLHPVVPHVPQMATVRYQARGSTRPTCSVRARPPLFPCCCPRMATARPTILRRWRSEPRKSGDGSAFAKLLFWQSGAIRYSTLWRGEFRKRSCPRPGTADSEQASRRTACR